MSHAFIVICNAKHGFTLEGMLPGPVIGATDSTDGTTGAFRGDPFHSVLRLKHGTNYGVDAGTFLGWADPDVAAKHGLVIMRIAPDTYTIDATAPRIRNSDIR